MKFILPARAFPRLALSPEEEYTIRSETDRTTKATRALFDEFAAQGRTLPADQYTLMKTKDRLNAYRVNFSQDPTSSSYLASPYSSSSSSNRSAGKSRTGEWVDPVPMKLVNRQGSHQSVDERKPELHPRTSANSAGSATAGAPKVIVTGFVEGTIEDFALSNIAETELLCKMRGAYVHDGNDDIRILAKIHGPTREDPFTFLGVKWASKRLSYFSLPNDMVYAESCGVVHDGRGTVTAAYHVLKSVEIARIGNLEQFNVRRMRTSICTIVRKHDDRHVEIFCHASVPVQDNEPVNIASFEQTLIVSCDALLHCAFVRKLMWLSQQKQAPRNSLLDESEATSKMPVRYCRLCNKSLRGKLRGIFRPSNPCHCCRQIVCRTCTLDTNVVVDVAVDSVTQRAFPFCLQCVSEANRLPASDVARAAVVSNNYNAAIPRSKAK
uniref:FYVE-type domain-containing protein n=1 Tax=Globisporangium ultimum (strain ATCC 200006 / CBS 805.95 / DAOM BR144) TaxID=431595 RepID=K3WFX4_GLOUD